MGEFRAVIQFLLSNSCNACSELCREYLRRGEFMNPSNCQQITSMLQKRDKTVTSLNNEFNGGLNYLYGQI